MRTKLSIFCSKVIEAGWLVAVIAVPLFFNIHTARTFEPDKLTLMRSLAIVMAVAWIIKVMEEGSLFNSSEPLPFSIRLKTWLKQPFVLPTLCLVTIYIISTIFAISPRVALWGSYQRLQGSYTFLSYVVIFALMAANMTERSQVDRFINTIILTSIPISLYGIIQHNGLDPLPWAGDVTRRVASNMGNAIFVASYLIMVVPITLVRLVNSMTAIVTEENASWGHTILSAVYIFVLAIQMLTILYSQSRGPQVGLLGAFALMGLLILLILRQRAEDKSILSFRELGQGALLVIALGVAGAAGGGLGYLGGLGIDALLSAARLEAEGLTLLGAALGGLIGFTGVYVYLAAAGKGWRWMWTSWPILAILAVTFVILLNIPQGPLQPLQSIPYLGRMGQLTDIDAGTGKVRVLIWEGALELISPHRPIGVEGEYSDSLNAFRPLIGYGPESMFNAFAYAYPPELAYHEARGSSADRSHNETMDSLVITGVIGLAAFYFLIISLFYFALKWLGWVSGRKAGYWLLGLMAIVGLAGAITPYFVWGNFSLSAVFLPFGLFAAAIIYVTVRAFLALPGDQGSNVTTTPLLLIGLLGAFAGHFLEVHFVFSIAATYTYFWSYLGMMVALGRMQDIGEVVAEETEPEAAVEEEPASSPAKRRRSARRLPARRPTATGSFWGANSWESWVGSHGLVLAIILMILVFDFVPVQFDISTGRYSLLWMTTITILVGAAITLSDITIKKANWRRPINWGMGVALYLVTSAGYAGFYFLFHSWQRLNVLRLAGDINQRIQGLSQLTDAFSQQQALREAATAAVASANSVFSLLGGFYLALFILMLLIAFMLSQGRARRLAGWRAANWWLYPPLIVAGVLLITFKNVNVVKADTLLKEGQKYRDARLWDLAIAVHEAARDADPDEDFYYLMLALNYQLKAQDGRQDAQTRELAWREGERIALEARDINKYNPDNTGNMGRYYFTIAQLFDQSYYDQALDFFKKAAQLAPQNVDYYNLVGQAYYAKGNYDEALSWYQTSTEIDERYFPTQLYKGDTHVAQQEIEEAIEAHKNAIRLNAPGFIDDNFDQRLNFYLSINRADELVEAFQDYIDTRPETPYDAARAKTLWGIGHTYLRSGQSELANNYFQQALDAGYNDANAFVEIGDSFLAQEEFARAESAYQEALAKNQNLPQVHSSLGFIYARTGRIPEAIEANKRVLESLPNDYDSNKNLALLYQQVGDLQPALTHAQIALDAAPDNAKADLQAFIAQIQQLLE